MPPPAAAVEPPKRKLDKAALEEAKRAYAAGEAGYQAGDYKTAIKNFQDAQAIIPSALAAYWLALSFKADGQVPEAIAEFKSLLASSAAQQRLGASKLAMANATLEELNRTPGVITLGSEPAGATVSVDGEVRPGATPMAVEVAPGSHTLTVSLPGYQSMDLELDVPPGAKGEQTLTLTALPPPPAPPAGAAAPEAAAPLQQQVVLQPTGTSDKRRSKVPLYAVLGIAGAGAVVGGVFGVLALGNKSDFKKHPTNKTADDQERNATISDIGFGAAITFGLAALVMATDTEELPGTPAQPATASAHSQARQLAVSPYANTNGGGAEMKLQF